MTTEAPWLVPDWPAPARVRALSTTRQGGLSQAPYGLADGSPGGLNLGTHVGDDPSAVAGNRARLAARLPAAPGWLEQVHGCAIATEDQFAADGVVPQADASIATTPARVCAVMTADCLPVLLCDRAGTVVGAAHAGWRGLCGGVIESTVARMGERAGAQAEWLAWLGPAIGPQAFEVGAEVRQAFLAQALPEEAGPVDRAFRVGAHGKYFADIYALARIRLARAGCTAVYGGDACTVSDAQRFYSYRRDGVTGRMASLVWLAA
ncbi:peptidoglycan editing factor PgeF [Cupriavidus basilensis]